MLLQIITENRTLYTLLPSNIEIQNRGPGKQIWQRLLSLSTTSSAINKDNWDKTGHFCLPFNPFSKFVDLPQIFRSEASLIFYKLIRSGKSIGRYCSDNIGVTKLFTMYSSDGYAALVFKTDSSVTRRGFKFTFQLKSYNTDFLNTYGSINCY